MGNISACACLGGSRKKKQQEATDPNAGNPTGITNEAVSMSVNLLLILINKQSLYLPFLGKTTGNQIKSFIYERYDQQLRPEQFVLQHNQDLFTNSQSLSLLAATQIKLVQRKAELWEIQGLRFDKNKIENQTGQKGVVYMSCGNFFSRRKVIDTIWDQIYSGASSIVCPICSQAWPSKQYFLVAGFTVDEINEVNIQLSYNLINSNQNIYNLTGSIDFQDINPEYRKNKESSALGSKKYITSNELITVSVSLLDASTKTLMIPVNQTVADLKNQIFLLFNELRPEQAVLLQNQVILKPEQLLKALAKNKAMTVTQKKAEVWQIKELKSDKIAVDPISCLPGVAIMTPCGHQIGRISMVEHIKYQLQSGRYQITCPERKSQTDSSICGQLWEQREWRLVAGYTIAEMNEIDSKLSENMVKANSKPCPHCGNSISNLGIQTKRVRCPKCSNKPDFCFACLQPWKGNKCNSQFCSFKLGLITNGGLQREFMLRKAPSSSRDFSMMTPKYRLCPKCKANVIENTEHCKHTPCPCSNLEGTFCFVCLSICKNGVWSCGGAFDYCERAPNQRFD